MNYTSNQIQDISSEFRTVARRLSRTDYSQCNANLKRFMNAIASNKIIKNFISEKNNHKYDIQAILNSRPPLSPFEVSPDTSKEISFAYQLLTYSIEKFDGDFTQLYGTFHYTSYKSTVNDEMQKFIRHIVDPLIDHINEYLHSCHVKATRDERENISPVTGGITANYSTVVVGSKVEGNVSTRITIDHSTKNNALELIASIKDSIIENDILNKEDISDILEQIEEDLNKNQKPKKGFLSALKALCEGSVPVISLVTTLIKLFT